MIDRPAWYATDVDEPRSRLLWEHVRGLEEAQAEVHRGNLLNARLFQNRELTAFDWGHNQIRTVQLAPVSRQAENLALSIGETVVSLIGKARPKATPQTSDADWELRNAAHELDQALYGEFQRLDVWGLAQEALRDAFIFGLGVLYGAAENDGIVIERVFPDEIIVDQAECLHDRRPLTVARRRALPVETALSIWGTAPEARLAIREAANKRDYLSYRSPGPGYVVITEGWCRSTRGQVGRHVVTCGASEDALVDEEYTDTALPFVFFHWQVPITGFYCPSGVEQVLPYQLRLNEVNAVIRDAQDVMARPRLLVSQGSQVDAGQFDNRIGRVISYLGVKPEAVTWPAVSAELYNERDRIVRSCFEFFGIPRLFSQGALPGGARLDSSVALREYSAINQDRFANLSQRFENLHLDVARLVVRLRGAAGGSVRVTNPGKGTRELDWSLVLEALKDKSYDLTLEASSVLNQTPAARQDTIRDWLQNGVISPEEFRLLLQHPDLEHQISLTVAASKDIDAVIWELSRGRYEEPTPYQDLVQGVNRVSLALLDARRRGAPESTLQLFRDWIESARAILEIGAPAAPAAAPVPTGAPGPNGLPTGLAPPSGPETPAPGVPV
jgi:hypothetical protein